MAKLVPYINFADRGREILEFYKSIFGGEYEIQLVKDSPMRENSPSEWGERIMHATFTSGDITFFGSDIISDLAGREVGNTFSLGVTCDSAEQIKDYADKLSVGGKTIWPVTDSDWGSLFGQVIDKYGHQWMLDYTKPKEV